jgi:hypothetical protein
MPLTLYRGDTAHWQFILWMDTAKTQPADLTGAAAKAEIRDRAGGALITAISCFITLPNFVNATLSSADSAKLPNSGAWDLQITYASGDVATVLAGPVNVTSDVTTVVTPTPSPLRRVR